MSCDYCWPGNCCGGPNCLARHVAEATPEQIVAFLTGGKMGIVERLHTIRDHLRTGAVGQREVWEEWLDEAAAEIRRLRAYGNDANTNALLAQADNERLRALLEANCNEDVARRALEPKP